jgi:predicted AAA+ superfamily ATPase
MFIERSVTRGIQRSSKSVLLLGPRQTGKSTLIRSLKPDVTINLARETEYLAFARNPSELEARLRATHAKTIFIDEVQRIPSLLNTIQAIIDEGNSPRFFLTGSSARKLRRGHANLLPGRIIHFELGPLVASELREQINLEQLLRWGSLPGIWTEKNSIERESVLDTYAATYVREEIQAESLTRNLEGFSRFLFAAASRATRNIDFSKISVEAAISRTSAIRYFEILEDTLLATRVEAFSKSSVTRIVQHPRFYFFDNGVLNALLGNYHLSPDRIGFLFENLLFSQLYYSAKACGKRMRMSTFRTESGAEVDFICEIDGVVFAIEVKASKNIGSRDLSGLASFASFYGKEFRPIVAYLGDVSKKIDGVDILPWSKVFEAIGLDE